MAYDTDAIERDISTVRQTLGRQISEAEAKARRAVDWRTHYRRNPLPMLAAAAATGLVASALFGRNGSSPAVNFPASREAAPGRSAMPLAVASATAMERLGDALIAAASMKVAEYVESWLPGFHKEFARRAS